MPFKIIKATEPLEARPLFTVIYGSPGVGKTSLSFTMPGPILHFDFDRGILRADQTLRPDTVQMETFGEVYDFVMSSDFEKTIQENGYKSVILDTLGTLLDNYAAPYLISKNPKNGNGSGGLGLSGWGNLGVLFNQFINRLRSLGLEVGAIAHSKAVGDDNDKKQTMAIKGGSLTIVKQSADLIGYMAMFGDHRKIDFLPHQDRDAKSTGITSILTVPKVGNKDYDGFMAGVLEQVKIKMKEQSAAQVEFNKVLDQYKTSLSKCEKAADFDAFINDMSNEESKLLRTTLKPELKAALNAAGFYYDTEEKKVLAQVKETADESES